MWISLWGHLNPQALPQHPLPTHAEPPWAAQLGLHSTPPPAHKSEAEVKFPGFQSPWDSRHAHSLYGTSPRALGNHSHSGDGGVDARLNIDSLIVCWCSQLRKQNYQAHHVWSSLPRRHSLLSSHPHMKPQAQGPQGLRRQRAELAWWRRVQGPTAKAGSGPSLAPQHLFDFDHVSQLLCSVSSHVKGK